MARVIESRKAAAVNPLKMSQPLGASYAFIGLGSCMRVMHGSQGCTLFGLVLLVRHFKEAIPLQTTAMNEATTVMGGFDNIEKAILNIRQRAKPEIIAICSTGLTETRGDDVEGALKLIRERHPELSDTMVVYVSTPDYLGAFEVNEEKCIGCGRCFRVCPRGVLELVGLDEDGERIALDPDGDEEEEYEKKALMQRWFPALVAKNAGDMKWKKFLYRKLCEREQILICKSPSCAACTDYRACFGPEV